MEFRTYAQYDRTAGSIKFKYQLMPNMDVSAYGNSWGEERQGGNITRIKGKNDTGSYSNPNINQLELGSSFEWKPTDISTFILRGASSNYDQRVFEAESGEEGSWKNALENTVFGDAQYTRYLTPEHLLSTGISDKYEYIQETTQIGTKEVNDAGMYLQDEMNYHPVNLVFGARYDYNSDFGSYLSPRGAIMFKPVSDLTLRGSYGFGFKAPMLFFEEMHFCSGTAMLEFVSNPSIQPEKSRSANFSIEYQPGAISLGINLFRTDIKDMVEAKLIGEDTATGIWKYQYVNVGKALTQGVELNTTTRFGKGLSLSLGYSYLDATDEVTDEPLPFESKHSGNWRLGYENHKIGLDIGLSGEFVGSMPTNQNSSPNYTLWNLKLSQRVRTNYTFFIGVDDIFDYAQKTSIQDDVTLWGPTRGRYLSGGIKVNF